jgi:hypothetical protein
MTCAEIRAEIWAEIWADWGVIRIDTGAGLVGTTGSL